MPIEVAPREYVWNVWRLLDTLSVERSLVVPSGKFEVDRLEEAALPPLSLRLCSSLQLGSRRFCGRDAVDPEASLLGQSNFQL